MRWNPRSQYPGMYLRINPWGTDKGAGRQQRGTPEVAEDSELPRPCTLSPAVGASQRCRPFPRLLDAVGDPAARKSLSRCPPQRGHEGQWTTQNKMTTQSSVQEKNEHNMKSLHSSMICSTGETHHKAWWNARVMTYLSLSAPSFMAVQLTYYLQIPLLFHCPISYPQLKYEKLFPNCSHKIMPPY